MSRDVRKQVLGVSDQVQHNTACKIKEGQTLDILNLSKLRRGTVLSVRQKQRPAVQLLCLC